MLDVNFFDELRIGLATADDIRQWSHGEVKKPETIDYSSRAAIARGEADLLPPVDLLVRTGGERRLSDFLLWECAYAELLFLDVLWPDITSAHLDAAFADFASRDRRFGSIPHRASA